MVALSANLGFLWTELALADAIRAAKGAGFTAVECHFPYDQDAISVREALSETNLPMLALNTVRGDTDNGDFGLTAVPGREAEARDAIDQAIAYGRDIGAKNVHVMAGRTRDEAAEPTFIEGLAYAADRAQGAGMGILIEPINHRDAPDYFLSRVEQAAGLIQQLGRSNIQIMFDCYHVQIMQGDLIRRFQANQKYIGHVQIAAVPSRAEPDEGELHYPHILQALDESGYSGFVGAEYKPRTTTEAGLGWMTSVQVSAT